MLAMQYTIQLPEDYDMTAIEARVEKRKPLFKQVPGLVHKSYLACFSDKLYAPFYIWSDVTHLRDFLLDDLFGGVTASFNRPRVRSWTVLNQVHGKCEGVPAYAVREADPIPAEEKLEKLLEREKQRQEALAERPELYLSVIGLDADRWELMRYSVWKDAASAPLPEGDCVQRYRVLHL